MPEVYIHPKYAKLIFILLSYFYQSTLSFINLSFFYFQAINAAVKNKQNTKREMEIQRKKLKKVKQCRLNRQTNANKTAEKNRKKQRRYSRRLTHTYT